MGHLLHKLYKKTIQYLFGNYFVVRKTFAKMKMDYRMRIRVIRKQIIFTASLGVWCLTAFRHVCDLLVSCNCR